MVSVVLVSWLFNREGGICLPCPTLPQHPTLSVGLERQHARSENVLVLLTHFVLSAAFLRAMWRRRLPLRYSPVR